MQDYVYEFKDKPETKLLVLYIMYQSEHIADCPHMPKQLLSDFISEHINANYFVVQQSILELCQEGYITQFVENHKDCLEMQQKGLETLQYLFGQIPKSVMDKIDEIIYNSVKEYKNKEDIVVDYWAEDEGCYTASLKIYDKDKNALHFALSLPNEIDAQILARMFKEKPIEIYQKLIALSSEYIDIGRKEKKQ